MKQSMKLIDYGLLKDKTNQTNIKTNPLLRAQQQFELIDQISRTQPKFSRDDNIQLNSIAGTSQHQQVVLPFGQTLAMDVGNDVTTIAPMPSS